MAQDSGIPRNLLIGSVTVPLRVPSLWASCTDLDIPFLRNYSIPGRQLEVLRTHETASMPGLPVNGKTGKLRLSGIITDFIPLPKYAHGTCGPHRAALSLSFSFSARLVVSFAVLLQESSSFT